MSRKKTAWFELKEDETIEQCIERMARLGYEVVARKEKPLFREQNGEIIPIRQIIQFKGVLREDPRLKTND